MRVGVAQIVVKYGSVCDVIFVCAMRVWVAQIIDEEVGVWDGIFMKIPFGVVGVTAVGAVVVFKVGQIKSPSVTAVSAAVDQLFLVLNLYIVAWCMCARVYCDGVETA